MNNKIIISFLSALLLIFACRRSDEKNLDEIEKQELAKGIRNDIIFHGLFLGMTKEAFADTCRARHAEGLFDEGGSQTIEYELKNGELKFLGKVSFYPNFKDNKISEMPVRFKYSNFDGWNPQMKTDKLLKDVNQLMAKWYGDGFFAATLSTGFKGFAQVSGNRRITISAEKDDEILVLFTDLMVKK